MITSVLLVNSILFISAAIRYALTGSKLHKQSALILTIAGSVYFLMSILYGTNTETNLRLFRYMDWFLTVPLMVNQMISLSSFKGTYNLLYCVITSVLMLACGFVGELGVLDKTFMGVIGTIFALFTFLPLFNQIDKRTNKIYYFIMTGWLFYPIVYFVSDTINIIILYSIVDLIVKIGFAEYLYKKLV